MLQDFWVVNHPQKLLAVARLPLQFVLIWWAYQYTKHSKRHFA